MTAWDAHDARASQLSPRDEAALIRRLAADRAMGALRHKPSCLCDACRVRRWAAKQRLARDCAESLATGLTESLAEYDARTGGRS